MDWPSARGRLPDWSNLVGGWPFQPLTGALLVPRPDGLGECGLRTRRVRPLRTPPQRSRSAGGRPSAPRAAVLPLASSSSGRSSNDAVSPLASEGDFPGVLPGQGGLPVKGVLPVLGVILVQGVLPLKGVLHVLSSCANVYVTLCDGWAGFVKQGSCMLTGVASPVASSWSCPRLHF